MASADQPLKKRKMYDQLPPLPHQHPPYHHHFAPPPPPPAPLLSPDEIMRRRRNREEIRGLYECYRRIKFCASQKDVRLMPDIEQAYLSLITASRGCTSVQRVVAELIPRYASYCPTALEAAAKVSINMYSWSLSIIMRGEDVDGVAYQTAKACIFGLVDICCTASYEAPTSSVIRGICAAVFVNVLTFFTSTFEGNDIYHIGSQEIQKLHEPMEFFYDLKQENSDDNSPILYKLFKFRALCLLRIFCSCPKNLIAACFELLNSGTDAVLHKRGQYFLTQVTSHLNADDKSKALTTTNDVAALYTDSDNPNEAGEVKSVANSCQIPDKSLPQSEICFMQRAINKDPSLRGWVLSKYKKLCEKIGSQDNSEISSIMEKMFGPLSEMSNEADFEESDEDKFDPSKYVSPAYLVPKILISQHDVSSASGVHDIPASDAPCEDNAAAEDVGQNIKSLKSATSSKVDIQLVDESFPRESESSLSTKNMEIGSHDDSCPDENSTPKDLKNDQFLSPAMRKQLDYNYNDTKNEYHAIEVKKNQGSSVDYEMPGVIPYSKDAANILRSTKHHSFPEYRAASNQNLWYCDGDPVSMDVFSASNQLWISSLGCDASEATVRLQFEDFGSLDQLLIFPSKDFALVEYRNIMDAVKAREYMQGSSIWGGCLRIKFLDRGLGSRGAVNGVAFGDSCHVYIGKVLNQWTKDEILNKLIKAGLRNPRLVTDLTSESALLLEFWSAEEAATAMVNIRHHRRELLCHTYPNKHSIPTVRKRDEFISGCQLLVRQIDASVCDEELINAFSRFGELCGWNFDRRNGSCLINLRSYEAAELAKCNLHGARFGPKSILVEVISNNHGSVGNNMLLSHVDSCPPDFEGASRNLYDSSFMNKPKNSIHDHISPRVGMENLVTHIQDRHPFQSTWSVTSNSEIPDIGPRKVHDLGIGRPFDFSYTESPATSHVAAKMWQYKKQEFKPQITSQESLSSPSISTHGSSIIPPPIAAPSYVRPVNVIPTSSWDSVALNPPLLSNQNFMPSHNRNGNSYTPGPFFPSSVTPLSHMPGSSLPSSNHMATGSDLSSIAPPPPPSYDMPIAFPSSHPPLPLSHPPSVPPLPSSPPPSLQSFNSHLVEPYLHYQWQGNLSKSGVHYCTIYATREDSSTCEYSNTIAEPIEWPAKLDVTKRTDFQHVKTNFACAPPWKREICRLLPSSASDQKGFHDFISYLKQRECAGVIKIPAGKSIWARLLFILPHSPEFCSMFAIAHHPAECLLALILPKETNSELA